MGKAVIRMIMGILVLGLTVSAGAAEVNRLGADQLKGWLAQKKPVILADIQKQREYEKHHFFGSIETDAYPVKQDVEKRRLDTVIRMFNKTGNPVVVIGPRGTNAAKRAAMYLIEQGVPADKVFILDGGIKKWPDQEELLDTATGCA